MTARNRLVPPSDKSSYSAYGRAGKDHQAEQEEGGAVTAREGSVGRTPGGGRNQDAVATPPGWTSDRLRALRAWGLVALSIAMAATAVFLRPGHPQLWAVALLPLLLAFGLRSRAAGRAGRPALRGALDAPTGLYNADGLTTHGETLLARSRRRSQPSTLAVFDCSDLLEVRHIYGDGVARRLALHLASALAGIAGERGLAARTGPTEFALLLPGLDRDRAVRAIRQVLGSPAHLEFEAGGHEIVLLPQLLLWQMTVEDRMADRLAAARHQLTAWREREALRQHYLRRERERHSRPMPLAAGS